MLISLLWVSHRKLLHADASCVSVTFGAEDENGNQEEYVNRLLVVDGDADLAAVPFGGCPSDDNTGGDTGGDTGVATGIADFSGVFNGTTAEDDVYTFPASAESWAGFSNENADLYPISISEAGTMTFNASVPSGGAAEIYFRFEKNAYPDVEPSYNTANVTISGADSLSYSIDLPSQGENTFRSFLMYIVERDVSVAVSDVTLYVDENTGGGDPGPVNSDVTFSVDMTGVVLTDGNPTLQSTFNGWCGACNPMSDDDGDNVWTVTVNIPQGDHEYKYALGAWVSQETVPADCDNTLGANRSVTVTGDVTLATDVYSGCPGDDTSGVTDTGPVNSDVTFSVDMTGVDLTDGNPTLQSTFNSWCGDCNPMSDDDADNIWTVTVNIPQGDYEYKYALGAWVSQEAVPGDCENTLGANRAVTVTGDVTLATDVYNGCPVGDTGGGDTGGTDPELTPADGFVISEAFGGTTIGEGSVYTYPAGTEAWAGFANTNTSLYPMTIAEDSVITFTGSVPAGGDADVRFRFEFNPHPDVDPSFNTAAVTVSGVDAATYSVDVPAQGANTFSSFLLYLNTQDVGVVVTDIAISAAPAGPVDSDNDGVNDDEDAFPNDASETADY